MHFHLTTVLLAFFAFLQGNYASPPPAGTLMVFRNQGGLYSGYYLHSFHVAAGISVPTLEPDFKTAAPAEILGDSSLIIATNPSIPFYIHLVEGPDHFAPPGYEPVLIDATVVAYNFILAPPDNRLVYIGPGAHDIVFSACPVPGIPPYESQGPKIAVFWQWRHSPTLEGCEEVYLVAQY